MKEIVAILRDIRDWVRSATLEGIAYPYPVAARKAGISLDKLRQHIERGELVPSYVDSKPVIMHEELVRWLRSRPAEAPEPTRRRS